jgi:hypothetical protein
MSESISVTFDTIENMQRRQNMSILLRKTLGVLLLLLSFTLSPLAHAQGSDSLFSTLSPQLSKYLTDTASTIPVTNISYYMLVPPRPTYSDPTGSSLFANILNPTANSFALDSAPAQTDTALRGATQAGQLNPFGLSSARLDQLLGGGGVTAAVPNYVTSAASLGGSNATTSGFSTMSLGAVSGFGEQSGWGGNNALSADSQTSASGWGTAALSIERVGRRMDQNAALGTEQDARSSSSGTLQEQGFASGSDFQTLPLGLRSPSAVSTAGRAASSSATGLTARSSGPGNLSYANGQTSTSLGRVTASSQSHMHLVAATRPTPGASAAGAATEGAAKTGEGVEAPQTLEELLLFSPRSYTGYSFGETPFASPSYMERTFLKPNIFATVPVALATERRKRAAERWRGPRRPLNGTEGLAGGDFSYGLSSTLGKEYSHLGVDRLGSARKRNPYLSPSGLGSGNPPGLGHNQ